MYNILIEMKQNGVFSVMKKILALLLTVVLLFAVAACGDATETDSSSAASSTSEVSSDGDSSTAASSASEVSFDDDSSTAVSTSEDSSEETSDASETEDPGPLPAFIDNFLSIGAVTTTVTANSAESIRLTGVDQEPESGAIVLYTSSYDLPEQEALAGFAVAVFTYDQSVFGYVKTAFYEAGEAEDAEIPSDGFVVAADAERQSVYVKRLRDLDDSTTVFPHGLRLYNYLDYDVKKVNAAPTIDGVFDESEWKEYLIDEIDAENESWSYAQFEKDNYYATASYYTAYDENYLYLCVVVSSPYHYCPITKSNAGDMWQYECIQVKVSSESPDSEYILTNFDHVANNKAVASGVVRSYGFACNNEGETCYYESGFTTTFTGKCACSRDDAKQETVYEVAIPWAEFGITPEAGDQYGLTFSINSTNADDIANGVWKNITYRNGGGVIGRNDWSKIPVITLK